MKLTAILLLSACLQVSARGYSQVISLNMRNASLEKVMEEIQRQSGYNFLYTKAELQNARNVNVNVLNVDLSAALAVCFKDQPINYSISGKFIVLKARPSPSVMAYLYHFFRGDPQPPVFHGRVINDQNQVLEGASVQIKGSRKGTLTGSNGEFQLNGVAAGTTIIVSFAGYTTLETVIAPDNRGLIAGGLLLIVLHPSINVLDQMQVVAYGNVTKRFNTGDVTTIKAEEIARHPVNNPLMALEGRVPGMDIRQTTGLPGGAFSVLIRGYNSISSGSDPLYMIDGVPYPGGQVASGVLSTNVNLRGGNGLNFINPADIESIDVLKDADATAIYGSRGSNGVVLITTKKGKPGRTRLNIDAYSGVGHVTRMPTYLGLREYLDLQHEVKRNSGFPILPTDYQINGIWDSTRYTDWAKVFLGNNSHINDVQATVSGGTENTQYTIGAGYHKESTIYPGDGADQKGSLHFSLNNYSPDKRVTVQLTGSYVADINTVLPVNLGPGSGAVDLPPDAPKIYKPDGSLNWENNTFSNPFAQLNIMFKSRAYNLFSTAVVGYHLLKGLDVRASLGYTSRQVSEFNGTPLSSINPAYNPTATNRVGLFNDYDNKNWSIEPQATYTTKLGLGTLSALAGYTLQQNHSYSRSITASGYSSDLLLQSMKAAPSIIVYNERNTDYKYTAGFGRLNYNWAGKYILNLNGRYDGSSRFGPGRQFHFFSSAGFAYIFTEEKWIHNNLRFLSFGKLRGSYGTTGNDQFSDYQFMELYNSFSSPYQGIQGLYPANLFNPDLAWEVNKKGEVGLELGFLKDNAILINANYYRNRSSSLLVQTPLSEVTGFNGISANLPALIQNTGLEFSLNTTNIKTKNFTWSSYGTLTLPHNKLVSFPGFGTSGYSSVYSLNQPLNVRFVYNYAGVDPQTGYYTFYDNTGKVTGTPQTGRDQTAMIKLDPKFYGSAGTTFSYKGFTLDMLFIFNKRNATSVFISQPLPFGIGAGNALASTVQDRWQKPGDKADVQVLAYNINTFISYSYMSLSNRAYTDASYIRLRNVYLSYQFAPGILKKIHLQGLRVYGKAENLFTITSYKEMDPETISSIPPVRMLTGGLQITL